VISRLFALICAVVALGPVASAQSCKQFQIEGDAANGQLYSQSIGSGLVLTLAPQKSGWRIGVRAAQGFDSPYDYAEVATPPFQSVNPLLISTDYAFRAQDAIAWDPRNFQFVTTSAQFGAVSRALATYLDPKNAGTPRAKSAEQLLLHTPAQSAHGSLRVLSAVIQPGAANQSPAAAAVAQHLSQTPFTVANAARNAAASPLGQIISLHFRVTLTVPREFHLAPGLESMPASCAQ
jgi:hypothetical protein